MEDLVNKVNTLLKSGVLPNSDLIFLYNKYPKSDIFKNNIAVLERAYNNAPLNEKFIMNNLIFILEFLSGEDGLKDFIKRSLKLDVYKMAMDESGVYTYEFFKQIKLPNWQEALKELLDDFFNLDEFERKTILINIITMLWNNKFLISNKDWLKLEENFSKLLKEAIDKDLIEDVMMIHFVSYVIFGNNYQTRSEWQKFNKMFEEVASKYYKNWDKKLTPPKAKKTKKIGFLIDRIVLNSPYKMLYSLVKSISKDADVYVYSMRYVDKQVDDEKLIKELEKIGAKVYVIKDFDEMQMYYPHSLKAMKLREKIIDDEIEYLVGGSGDIANFIFSTRTAPNQIFWSHGYCDAKIENIDKKISHFKQECEDFEVFELNIDKEFLIGTKKEKEDSEKLKKLLQKQYGKNAKFVGTISRPSKLDSKEYINTVSEILRKNKNVYYIVAGSSKSENIKSLIPKDLEDRFIFVGFVNPHVWGWVIDVVLDTFPLRQGQSKNELIAKGKPVVFMDKYLNDTIRNWYEGFDEKPFAKDEKEYIEIANRLLNDKEYYKKLSKWNKKIFDNQKTNFLEVINAK